MGILETLIILKLRYIGIFNYVHKDRRIHVDISIQGAKNERQEEGQKGQHMDGEHHL